MLDNKYFYIICRDGQIIEVKNKQETFEAVSGAMLNKGLVVLKEYGSMLNGVDISKVLNETQYEAWVSSTTPKEYIKDGAWRDGREKKVIRYEKWKQEEMDSRSKLEAPQERDLTSEEYLAKLEKYKPQFIRDWQNRNKEIIPPHNLDLTAKRKSLSETKDLQL